MDLFHREFRRQRISHAEASHPYCRATRPFRHCVYFWPTTDGLGIHGSFKLQPRRPISNPPGGVDRVHNSGANRDPGRALLQRPATNRRRASEFGSMASIGEPAPRISNEPAW